MCPGFPGVGGLVDAVAHRKVGTRQPFTTADVKYIGIRRRDGYPSNRAGWLIIKDRLPRPARVGCLPNSAIAHADVKRVRLARHTGRGLRPSSAIGPYRAPFHFA